MQTKNEQSQPSPRKPNSVFVPLFTGKFCVKVLSEFKPILTAYHHIPTRANKVRAGYQLRNSWNQRFLTVLWQKQPYVPHALTPRKSGFVHAVY
jgi:hypothetical protein